MRLIPPPLALALLSLLPIPALAATTPPGVNLRWDNCYDDGGTQNKTFACDTNTGSERLVLSFVLAAPLADVGGVAIYVEVVSASATLPSWWQFFNPGTCGQASLAITAAPPATSVHCADWASGFASANIAGYDIGYVGTNSASVLVANAVDASHYAVLDPNVEYSAGSLLIKHAKTVGLGSCAGCDVPVCLVIQRLGVFTSTSQNNVYLLTGANGPASQVATWQDAAALDLHTATFMSEPRVLIGSCVLASTPTRGSTWGAVKSLYR